MDLNFLLPLPSFIISSLGTRIHEEDEHGHRCDQERDLACPERLWCDYKTFVRNFELTMTTPGDHGSRITLFSNIYSPSKWLVTQGSIKLGVIKLTFFLFLFLQNCLVTIQLCSAGASDYLENLPLNSRHYGPPILFIRRALGVGLLSYQNS